MSQVRQHESGENDFGRPGEDLQEELMMGRGQGLNEGLVNKEPGGSPALNCVGAVAPSLFEANF